MAENPVVDTNTSLTYSKKLYYDLMSKELPIIIPFLWIPRSSRVSHNMPKQEDTVHVNLLKKPPTDEFLYISERIFIPRLLWDTTQIISHNISSSGVVIYLVDLAMNELYVNPVIGEDQTNRVSWKIRPDSTIATFVADKKKSVMLNNLNCVEPFSGYDWKGLTVTGTLAAPIITSDKECFAVVELYRRDGRDYNIKHLNLLTTVCHWIALSIEHNTNRLRLQIQQRIETYLLGLTEHYFAQPSKMVRLIRDIVVYAKETLNSARGEFLFLDCDKLTSNTITTHTDLCIAEFSLNLKKLLNIKDAYNDARFARENSLKTRYITRTALSMPVVGQHNRILGVLLIINKYNGTYTAFDEVIFQIFAKYCAIAMEYRNMHATWMQSDKWAVIYNDLYFYKITNIGPERKIKTTESTIVVNVVLPTDFYEFSFYPSAEDDLVSLSCWLLKSLKMTSMEILEFVMYIRRGYRDIPYHNFEHAFNMLHNLSCIIERNPEKFSYLEKISLLISGICHDLDHRAFTNHFLEISDSPFITLYDGSPMENHHFFIANMMVENTSLRKTMSGTDYNYMIKLIKELILATDLTRHMADRSHLSELCDKIYDKGVDIWYNNDEYRRIVRGLIITASDLSGQAKPFSIAQRLTKNILLEFYEEGERLRQLGHGPPLSMDIQFIDKIPHYQIQFLEIICLPCFNFLQIVLPNTFDMYNLAKTVLNTWQEVDRIRTEKNKKSEAAKL